MATRSKSITLNIFRFMTLLLLIISLPLTLRGMRVRQTVTPTAGGRPADIVIDPLIELGRVDPFWQALAQGGEEKNNMLLPVLDQISQLKPKFIRLDHVYDYYDVVSLGDGDLIFQWDKLDETVETILQTGATPFFSLSFMPGVIAADGLITDAPQDWNLWQELVQKTIEHYSGKNEKNLRDVYYEVWSEPDYFGDWKIGYGKNYQDLYLASVRGAESARDVNDFKIGGPATTALYQSWLSDFLGHNLTNDIRLDFYSWHRYSPNPQDFLNDVNQIDAWLGTVGSYHSLPKVISEWGSDSAVSRLHDEWFDAAHLVTTISLLLQKVRLAFIFEAKDGPPPTEEKFWGRWGLLTHNGEPKPKYHGLRLLNMMQGERIKLAGEGDWVKGFAVKNQHQFSLILANLDPHGLHQEVVPIRFLNIADGQYRLQEDFMDQPNKEMIINVVDHQFSLKRLLPANSVIVLRLIRT